MKLNGRDKAVIHADPHAVARSLVECVLLVQLLSPVCRGTGKATSRRDDMSVNHTVHERHDIMRAEAVPKVGSHVERWHDDCRVDVVCVGGCEWRLSVISSHEREKPDQPLLRVKRDPDREIEPIRDVDITVFVDMGGEKGTTEQR